MRFALAGALCRRRPERQPPGRRKPRRCLPDLSSPVRTRRNARPPSAWTKPPTAAPSPAGRAGTTASASAGRCICPPAGSRVRPLPTRNMLSSSPKRGAGRPMSMPGPGRATASSTPGRAPAATPGPAVGRRKAGRRIRSCWSRTGTRGPMRRGSRRAPGASGGCRPNSNERKPHAARTGAASPEATVSRRSASTAMTAGRSTRCRSGNSPKPPRLSACWTRPAKSSSGLLPRPGRGAFRSRAGPGTTAAAASAARPV